MKSHEDFFIATRKSKLALWQANKTKDLLLENNVNCKIREIVTSGDKIQHLQLADVDLKDTEFHHLSTGKGLFIKEIQESLFSKSSDIAVHSMKDLPVAQTSGLCVAALLPRSLPYDVLVLSPQVLNEIDCENSDLSKINFEDFKKLLLKSKNFSSKPIGTTSSRRQFLMKELFSETLNLQILRGNVDTRLQKLNRDEFSAILLSYAGLERLNLFLSQSMYCLPEDLFIPAAAQGVVAVECQRENKKLIDQLIKISCPETCLYVAIERMVLKFLDGDCNSTIGVHYTNHNIHILYKKLNIEKRLMIEVTSHDLEFIQQLYIKCNNIYSYFFDEILESIFGLRIKKILRDNFLPL